MWPGGSQYVDLATLFTGRRQALYSPTYRYPGRHQRQPLSAAIDPCPPYSVQGMYRYLCLHWPVFGSIGCSSFGLVPFGSSFLAGQGSEKARQGNKARQGKASEARLLVRRPAQAPRQLNHCTSTTTTTTEVQYCRQVPTYLLTAPHRTVPCQRSC